MLGKVGALFDSIEREAQSLGVSVVASAVDEHGNAVMLMRMPGAAVHSISMATRKAYTAISMQMDTADLAPLVQPGGPLFGLTEATGGQLVAFGGGQSVLMPSGQRLGVGISGGSTEQDIEILKAAVRRM